MNRRNFLQGLASIVPATLLAKLALPKVEATVEAVEETPVEPSEYWGYFAVGEKNVVMRPSLTRANEWVVVDLDEDNG